jgi:hypothetical protein
MPTEKPRKERVIHARIPESLDDEVKRRATDLGLSVSNLVRNVLQHTFGLVGDVVHDSAAIARAARGRNARAAIDDAQPMPGAPQVLGWQRVVLNVNAVCEVCNTILATGTHAGIGVLDRPGAPPFRCQSCLQEIENAVD